MASKGFWWSKYRNLPCGNIGHFGQNIGHQEAYFTPNLMTKTSIFIGLASSTLYSQMYHLLKIITTFFISCLVSVDSPRTGDYKMPPYLCVCPSCHCKKLSMHLYWHHKIFPHFWKTSWSLWHDLNSSFPLPSFCCSITATVLHFSEVNYSAGCLRK